MFKKIKEFFSKSPVTEATWPFSTARTIDVPIITPEPINAVPIPTPPVVEPEVKKAPVVKTAVKTTKAAPKPPVTTKPTTSTKRPSGRPSKKQ